ncbi:hypothetical protein ACNOYE_11125 [Nannocystaceae bacterium ST9]
MIEDLPIQFKRMRVPRKSMDDFDEQERLLDAAKALEPRYAFVLAAGDAGMRAGDGRAGELARPDHVAEARQAADDPDRQMRIRSWAPQGERRLPHDPEKRPFRDAPASM